jgi:hypothetical protein
LKTSSEGAGKRVRKFNDGITKERNVCVCVRARARARERDEKLASFRCVAWDRRCDKSEARDLAPSVGAAGAGEGK